MNDTNITRSPLIEPRFLKFFTFYAHTFLVAVGVIGNIFSIFVFLRSVRNAPKILTRNSLILLTTSNSMYLVLVWCYNVAPRLQYLNTMVPNRYSCKFIIYLINLAVSVNALITCSFSLERALAINFPLKARNIRSNHRFFFQFSYLLTMLVSFLLPSYNLFLIETRTDENNRQHCDIPDGSRTTYFNLTFIFVLETTAFPFLIITISNISIIYAIYKKRRLFEEYKRKNPKSNPNNNYQLRRFAFKTNKPLETNNSNYLREDRELVKPAISAETIPWSGDKISSSPWSSFKSGHNRHSNNMTLKPYHKKILKQSIHVQKVFNQNLIITRMLITISATFVLLHLPYLIAYSIHASFQLRKTKLDPRIQSDLKDIVKLTEILNILNYSIAGFLYFASGKVFREHLYAIFGCRFGDRKLKTFRL